jgi:hypothetical protein
MANNPSLFKELTLSSPTQDNKVNGIGTSIIIAGHGTFVFDIEADDEGNLHTIHIRNSIFVPDMKFCLLSPQHWAQDTNDNHPFANGTRMENYADTCILIWNQAAHCKKIPYILATNMPIFRLAPSTNSYCAFVADMESFLASSAALEWTSLACSTIADDYLADELLHQQTMPDQEGEIASDDETVTTSNVPAPHILSSPTAK